jgi:hypothetical protein
VFSGRGLVVRSTGVGAEPEASTVNGAEAGLPGSALLADRAWCRVAAGTGAASFRHSHPGELPAKGGRSRRQEWVLGRFGGKV